MNVSTPPTVSAPFLMHPLRLALCTLFATLPLLSSLRAEEKPPAAAEKPDALKPVVTEHTVTVGGKVLKYKATAGYLMLKDETEKSPDEKAGEKPADPQSDALKPKAKIFFVAYTVEGGGPSRPLTFAFNGGPGAASVWLQLGAMGPQRVKLTPQGEGTPAPYQLVENEWTWLEKSDLVFIDPVSTGYSRPVPGQSAQAFHGYQEDLKSVADFIRRYLTEHGRWLSPKLVVGESYGGLRAAALAAELQNNYDIYLNGVVVFSGVLNWQTLDYRPGNDLAFITGLPSYATAAWYHQKLSPALQSEKVEEIRRRAEVFAEGEYAQALAKGNLLPPDEQKSVAAKLSELIGLPAELIGRWHLRISTATFMTELLRAESRVIGRFDDRVSGVMLDPDDDYDPSFTTMRGNFTASMNSYLRDSLKFESELPYHALTSVAPWSYSGFQNRYLSVTDSLEEAMVKNRNLKVWVLAGYNDLAIPYFGTDYALRHLRLTPELMTQSPPHVF